MTAEVAEDSPASVLKRWDLSVIKAYLKRIWAAMHGERGPDDYELPEHDIAERVARLIAKRYGPPRVEYYNGDPARHGNGEKALLKWILGIVSALLVSGIVGVIVMYGQLSAIKKGQEGHEQRIDRLERERDSRAQNGAP